METLDVTESDSLCFRESYYFIAEDLWDVGYIQDRSPVVITASIDDAAGNTGTAHRTIYINVDTP